MHVRPVMLIKEGIIISKIQAGKNTGDNCAFPYLLQLSFVKRQKWGKLILLPAKDNLLTDLILNR